MIYHKHLLVNAKVKAPLDTEEKGIEFLRTLVEKINMKIIQGPFATYLDVPGNRGLTAIVMIETSHIAFHIWDEPTPALVQFDLYTCGTLNHEEVLAYFAEVFDPVETQFVVYDREHGFEVEVEGRF